MAVSSPCLSSNEKKHWWLSNRKVIFFSLFFCSPFPCLFNQKLTISSNNFIYIYIFQIVYKYIKDARNLIATQEQSEIALALNLLDAALALSPRLEQALELKARSLLYLRRFKDVADMLQDYIPSLKMASDDSTGSENSSQQLSRERVKLLSTSSNSSSESEDRDHPSFKCFSVSDLKKKVMAGLCKNGDKEGQWRYKKDLIFSSFFFLALFHWYSETFAFTFSLKICLVW